jgi:hypothetical protein
LAGELGQHHLKEGDTDARDQMEDRPARGGMHEADEIAPGKAGLHGRNGPLADRCPDAPQQGFQADAMLIRCPQLDLGVGECRGHRLQQRP